MRVPEPDRVESPNMTPMIDIVFQLLIFFLLSFNLPDPEGALRMQLPKRGTASAPAPLVEEIRVTIRRAGEACDVRVDRAPAGSMRAGGGAENRRTAGAAADLAARILAAGASGAPVVVDAGGDCPYEVVLGVVDALAARGLCKVEFAANPLLADVTSR